MIADEMQKWLIADKLAAAENGVAVAVGFRLGDETYLRAKSAAGLGVGILITGADDDGELLDSGASGFFKNDLEGRFRLAARVNERLQRQGALTWIGRGNKGFANFHEANRERGG